MPLSPGIVDSSPSDNRRNSETSGDLFNEINSDPTIAEITQKLEDLGELHSGGKYSNSS